MAWYSNHYICEDCDATWTDEWSCMCDDDCPNCDARHMAPFKSDDLTEVIENQDGVFVVLWSPETAEDRPDYRELGQFPTHKEAVAFLATG